MNKLLIAGAAVAAITFAPLAHAQPNQGDQCMDWHATMIGPDGRTMTCTHLGLNDGDSGHIMYWEYGPARDLAYRTSGYKTAPGDQKRLQDFQDYMANHGYPNGGGRTGVQEYEYQGFQTCDALKQGASESSQIGRLESILSRAEAGLVVTGAHQFFCPGV
jgi:Protein of unknown function (DUF732)